MSVPRVSPSEALDLLGRGYTFLDIRAPREHEAGHPPGALNIPMFLDGMRGVQANPEFLGVVVRAIPLDAAIVVGCGEGAQSQRAAMMLDTLGYQRVVELRGGIGGTIDELGRPAEPGWLTLGLPMTTEETPGGRWEELRQR